MITGRYHQEPVTFILLRSLYSPQMWPFSNHLWHTEKTSTGRTGFHAEKVLFKKNNKNEQETDKNENLKTDQEEYKV